MNAVSKEEALDYIYRLFLERHPQYRDANPADVYPLEDYQAFISPESIQRMIDKVKGQMHAEAALERSRRQPGERLVDYRVRTGKL